MSSGKDTEPLKPGSPDSPVPFGHYILPQDGLTLNFRALATNGYIDVYEKPALSQALSHLTGKDFGDKPKAWLRWYRNQQKEKSRNKSGK